MPAEAQKLIISPTCNEALSRAFLSRARSTNNASSQVRFAAGDKVMCGRGNNTRKSQWSMCWRGPGIVTGPEGLANRNGSVIAMLLSRQLETTFDSQKWKSNSRGMISTIRFMTQMNRQSLISVRLVRPVIHSLEVHPHRVMFQ